MRADVTPALEAGAWGVHIPSEHVWTLDVDADPIDASRFRRLDAGELPVPSAGFPTSRYALLECEPLTGRFRQIRRHLKHASHHMVGDTSHGDGRHNREFRMRGVHRMLLHAWKLGFPHPHDGRTLRVETPPDGEFARAMALFDWRLP